MYFSTYHKILSKKVLKILVFLIFLTLPYSGYEIIFGRFDLSQIIFISIPVLFFNTLRLDDLFILLLFFAIMLFNPFNENVNIVLFPLIFLWFSRTSIELNKFQIYLLANGLIFSVILNFVFMQYGLKEMIPYTPKEFESWRLGGFFREPSHLGVSAAFTSFILFKYKTNDIRGYLLVLILFMTKSLTAYTIALFLFLPLVKHFRGLKLFVLLVLSLFIAIQSNWSKQILGRVENVYDFVVNDDFQRNSENVRAAAFIIPFKKIIDNPSLALMGAGTDNLEKFEHDELFQKFGIGSKFITNILSYTILVFGITGFILIIIYIFRIFKRRNFNAVLLTLLIFMGFGLVYHIFIFFPMFKAYDNKKCK